MEKPQIEIRLTNAHGKAESGMLITLHLIIYLEDFCFACTLVNCYDGKAGVSLSEEARTKDNRADNAEGGFTLGHCQASRRASPKSWLCRNS
jgi:hypothetical protein